MDSEESTNIQEKLKQECSTITLFKDNKDDVQNHPISVKQHVECEIHSYVISSKLDFEKIRYCDGRATNLNIHSYQSLRQSICTYVSPADHLNVSSIHLETSQHQQGVA